MNCVFLLFLVVHAFWLYQCTVNTVLCNKKSASSNWKVLVKNCLFFSWQPESKFPFSQVRLPPEGVTGKPDFAENQEIEVYSRANEQEACGWWKAIIKVG